MKSSTDTTVRVLLVVILSAILIAFYNNSCVPEKEHFRGYSSSSTSSSGHSKDYMDDYVQDKVDQLNRYDEKDRDGNYKWRD